MTNARNTNSDGPVIVLFRNDLRVRDNRALAAAAETRRPVLPVYVLDEQSPGVRASGGAQRWWVHHSLERLAESLQSLGATLVFRRGVMRKTVARICSETNARAVFWNRRHEPHHAAADDDMAAALRADGVETAFFDGQLLHDPARLKTGSGGPYKVYSPFWRALMADQEPRDPVDAPKALKRFEGKVESEALASWKLLPTKPDWSGGLRDQWTPGEAGAHDRLTDFLHGAIRGYGEQRDIPGVEGTSRLSPHLTNGEITPFQIFAAMKSKSLQAPDGDLEKFRKELAWREFSYHLLFHNPELAKINFDRSFDAFEWQPGTTTLNAWQRGMTGYPIVDAGMRQLWQTGWMHNRVRLITASFVIKHLLVDWRAGEEWFWDTLGDADPASNASNWQWVAGSGADAAPYFRIFNPILQGLKFDPKGLYVRHYVPEIAKLSDKYIHSPWQAPKAELEDAGVKLGSTYPVPLVDHAQARERALALYKSLRDKK